MLPVIDRWGTMTGMKQNADGCVLVTPDRNLAFGQDLPAECLRRGCVHRIYGYSIACAAQSCHLAMAAARSWLVAS